MNARDRQESCQTLAEGIAGATELFFKNEEVLPGLQTLLVAPYKEALTAHGFVEGRVFAPLVQAKGDGWTCEVGCCFNDPLQSSNRLDITWTIELSTLLHVPGVCASPRVFLQVRGKREIRSQGYPFKSMHADYAFGPLQPLFVNRVEQVHAWVKSAWTELQRELANETLVANLAAQQWANALAP